MSTRQKRPSVYRHFAIAIALIGFQAYLGFSAIGGQFGIESQKQMLVDIEQLDAERAILAMKIASFEHRIDLLDPEKLDPDLLTERARMLLGYGVPDQTIVMLPEIN